MYSIGIVGDLHIDFHISSRKDDYFQTCLNKLEEVASKCSNVIILGDVFNKETLPNNYFYIFYSFMSYLKVKYNIKFYAIIGNHDIPNEDEDNLVKTSLGLCYITGLIELITVEHPVKIAGRNFYTSYVNLEKCKEHLKTLKLQQNDILLLHHYYEDEFEGLKLEDLSSIGCGKIFLGHNHTPFDKFVKQYCSLSIYRTGSLLRNSADKSSLTRDIYYSVLDDSDQVSFIKLSDQKPAIQVFTEKAYSQENLHKKVFIKNISEVIQKYVNNVSNQVKFSIRETLLELNTPQDSMQYIQTIYNSVGETFL